MNEGFIPLLRAIRDRPSWKKPLTENEALIELLFDTTFKKRKVEGVLLMPGQVLVKKRELAKRWGWNVKRVRRFLSKLAKERGELWAIEEEVLKKSVINPVRKTRALGTRITFLYWDRFGGQQ